MSRANVGDPGSSLAVGRPWAMWVSSDMPRPHASPNRSARNLCSPRPDPAAGVGTRHQTLQTPHPGVAEAYDVGSPVAGQAGQEARVLLHAPPAGLVAEVVDQGRWSRRSWWRIPPHPEQMSRRDRGQFHPRESWAGVPGGSRAVRSLAVTLSSTGSPGLVCIRTRTRGISVDLTTSSLERREEVRWGRRRS
jgi:hypothetical protein